MIVRSVSHMNRTNSESGYRIGLFVSYAPKLYYSFESDLVFRIISEQEVPVILDLLNAAAGLCLLKNN